MKFILKKEQLKTLAQTINAKNVADEMKYIHFAKGKIINTQVGYTAIASDGRIFTAVIPEVEKGIANNLSLTIHLDEANTLLQMTRDKHDIMFDIGKSEARPVDEPASCVKLFCANKPYRNWEDTLTNHTYPCEKTNNEFCISAELLLRVLKIQKTFYSKKNVYEKRRANILNFRFGRREYEETPSCVYIAHPELFILLMLMKTTDAGGLN